MTLSLCARWLNREDREAFEDLHANARGAAPFNSWAWWKSGFEGARGFRLLGAFEPREGGRLMGAVAFLARRRYGFLALDAPLPTPHSALLARDAPLTNPRRAESLWRDLARAFCAALASAPRLGVASILFPPSWTDPRGWQWEGVSVTPCFTYLCDIRNPESWERAWTTSVRARVKKCRKLGWPLRLDAPPGVFHALWTAAMRADGLAVPWSAGRYARWLAAAAPEECALQATVHPADAPGAPPLAGAVVLIENGVGSHLLAGATPEGRRLGAPSYLLAELGALLARQHGVRYYDLCGANVPDVAEFKKSFGGTLVPYWRAQWESPVYRALRAARDLLRPHCAKASASPGGAEEDSGA